MNNIDLSKYNIHTDLVVENPSYTSNHNKKTKYQDKDIEVTTINTKENKFLSESKKGNYITISYMDVTNFENRENLGKILEKELKKLLKINNIKDDDSCLVVGLGNPCSTPDALGPKIIDNIIVTRHIFLLHEPLQEGFRIVSALSPGVSASTGLETADYIKAISKDINPNFLIVIDALAAGSVERVGKTIQLTDTGIHPGSGIGNKRKEISKKTLGIPVIALGVPTVVDATTIVYESLNYLFKHISYQKDNQEISKLSAGFYNNYRNKIKNITSSKDTKEKFMGLFGSLNSNNQKELINEVLNAIDYNLIVTPKEIDFIINKLSDVISSSLNNLLHKNVSHY